MTLLIVGKTDGICTYSFDEEIAISTILCDVDLEQITSTTFQIPPQELERVSRPIYLSIYLYIYLSIYLSIYIYI